MAALLRASVSLDGKLLGASGKPLRRGIPVSRIGEAGELRLAIHPLIVGDDAVPTLSGVPGAFLPGNLQWELLSANDGPAGTIVVRFRRKRVRAPQV